MRIACPLSSGNAADIGDQCAALGCGSARHRAAAVESNTSHTVSARRNKRRRSGRGKAESQAQAVAVPPGADRRRRRRRPRRLGAPEPRPAAPVAGSPAAPRLAGGADLPAAAGAGLPRGFGAGAPERPLPGFGRRFLLAIRSRRRGVRSMRAARRLFGLDLDLRLAGERLRRRRDDLAGRTRMPEARGHRGRRMARARAGTAAGAARHRPPASVAPAVCPAAGRRRR